MPSAQGQAKTLQKQGRRSRTITEARQAVQQMRALSAVLPLLLSREDCRGVPLKRACCALHTCARNCSVGVRPLHGYALCQPSLRE